MSASSLNQKTAQIQNLDLEYLAQRLITKEQWLESNAQEAVRRYKNFLTLILKYPDLRSVPTEDIDEVWHAHILHTRNYIADCEAIFGRYIHHSPFSTDEQAQEDLSERFNQVARLYEKEFSERYTIDLDVSSFW